MRQTRTLKVDSPYKAIALGVLIALVLAALLIAPFALIRMLMPGHTRQIAASIGLGSMAFLFFLFGAASRTEPDSGLRGAMREAAIWLPFGIWMSLTAFIPVLMPALKGPDNAPIGAFVVGYVLTYFPFLLGWTFGRRRHFTH